MTYPFENLSSTQLMELFPKYWRQYVNELVDSIVNKKPKPVSFEDWWKALPNLKFNINL